MLRKIVASILLVGMLAGILPMNTWALSSGVISPESYPGKMEIKNVNGLGKNISTDFFGGAMTFGYPLSFPSGSRGMTPNLSLSYASNNTDAFSPYGYGFSLSIPRIQRSAKKGVSELYIGDEYAAFGNDLVKETGSQGRYRSKDGGDLNLYIQSGSSWIVETPEGKTLTFGGISSSRIADSTDSSKIYAWLVDEERDTFGHSIKYNYIQDGGQPYITDIFYGYEVGGTNPMYQIHFDYTTKGASLTSYRTQFEVSTKKLLSKASLLVSGSVKHTYSFAYDDPNTPTSHLVSISEEALGTTLPKTQFTYGNGQFQHMIVGIDNNRGGKANFEYSPSTGYRDNSGTLLNSKLPFMVMTLSKQTLEDAVTGIKSEESYSYSGGHYYYDSADLWGREYVGFGQVTISDEKAKKVLYFHQSQTSDPNPLKYQDHISKKGRVYRTDIFDKNSGKQLGEELVKYDSRVLFGERRLVYPAQKINTEFTSDGSHRDTAITYEYDDDGNNTNETRLGLVNANLADGTFTDIPGDTTSVIRAYISNTSKNLHNFQTEEKIYGFGGELLSTSLTEYDNTASGVTLGLLTAKKRQNVQNGDIVTTDRIVYSPTGMPVERYDAMNNKTSSTYDSRDIALVSSTNPLGWMTSYAYDYSIGKPTQSTNQNNVVSTTRYDGFGRVTELLQDTGSGDILLTRNNYNDVNVPNNTTSTQYFDANAADSKTTKSYMDGWGRTIATISTTEKSGQYSASQIRYDDDGNPIYAGYPIFVSSDTLDTSLILRGVTEGERYRAIAPGVSYQYDAIDRIISQRDARGITSKSYAPGRETITNALGYITEARYDGYNNLSSFIEKIDGRDVVTTYSYDGLGRPIQLTDSYNNIRTWIYDGLGRLASATDLHALGDTTYGTRSYSYDTLGRVSNYTNANNETISYSYDALSRITHESSPSSLDRTYSYDAGDRSLGTLSSVSDAGSMVSYTYDPLGRKTGEARTIGDDGYTLGYGYNPASVLTDIIYPDGGHTKYTYRNGFIEGVGYTDPSGNSTQVISDISYAPNSTMRSIRYGNGVVKNTERDANNNYRLTRATATATDGSKLLDTSYSYDAVSNITGINESGIEPLRKSINYTYDPLARLTSTNSSCVIAGYGRDQNKSLSYTYDDIGNIMSATDVGGYSYAGTNYANPHAVTTAGDTNYGYDTAGNTVTRTNTADTLSFTYSPYGEMLSSTKNGETTDYLYDYTRRRIVKSTLGLTEHHIIDGFEVEYESGALVPVSNEPILENNTGTTDSGALLTDSGITDSGALLTDSGITDSGSLLTDSGTTDSGSTMTDSGVTSESGTTSGSGDIFTGTGTLTSSGEIFTDSGTTESGATLTDSGSTNSGTTDTGSLLTDSGSITQTGSTESGTTSGSGEVISFSGTDSNSGTYIVVASYVASTLSGATPITLTTTLTHIYLGDEKIATFQSQTDDTPKTSDDDQFIFHISDHLNSSSLDLSSTGIVLQATDYQPFGKTITYQVTNQRVKGKKGGYKNKYLFANKQQDDETDLQYFEKRYYDNRIGRFTTEDPVFWEVGLTKRPTQYFTDPQQWNTYSYVRNNPVNLVDPTGEELIATSDDLNNESFRMTHDASLVFQEHLDFASQLITNPDNDAIDRRLTFYVLNTNRAYNDLKRMNGSAFGGKYAFDIKNTLSNSSKELRGRSAVIIGNHNVTLDELGNFSLGYTAQRAGISLSFTQFASLLYQIKSDGGIIKSQILDEINKDWRFYQTGYQYGIDSQNKSTPIANYFNNSPLDLKDYTPVPSKQPSTSPNVNSKPSTSKK